MEGVPKITILAFMSKVMCAWNYKVATSVDGLFHMHI